MMMTQPLRLLDLFRYFKNLPHQLAAITELEQAINKANPHILGREQGWFKTWSTAGQQSDLTAAIALIKEFEGCRLAAYPDPASGGDPWTIGYGTTRYSAGTPVKRGDKITVIEADLLLRFEIDRIADQLRNAVPHWSLMSNNQKSALVSFAYNLGERFYSADGFETISRCLREKDWQAVPDAMLLYRNPGTSVEAGLLRRRKAEGELWGKTTLPQQQDSTTYQLSPTSPFASRLTAHIQIGEFALNDEARRFDHQYQVDVAAELAAFLERVRAQFGNKPIIITSGYRPSAINQQVGGASNSEHLYSAPNVGAVDFYVDGVNINTVQNWCDKNWPYSLGYGAPKGFVHLGMRAGKPRVRWDY
jgi:GH24 family phage-related lysozyme (muramidase)